MSKGNLLRELSLETSNFPLGLAGCETNDKVRAHRLTCRTGCPGKLFAWMVT